MGTWKSERGYVGDTMADYLGGAFRLIGELKGSSWLRGRKVQTTPAPRMIDLADAVEFCSRGILKVEINPSAEHLREMKVSDLDSPNFNTIPNRGQIQFSPSDETPPKFRVV
jgi:hypothetical protein